MDWPSQSANKQMYTYSYSTYNNFIFYQSLLQHVSYIWLSVFKTVTMSCQTTQHNFTFLGLVATILNWGHTHYNRSYLNSIQVYTAYNLYTVTPQPEGPKNTLTNCISTPCFYITTCFNIVIKFCSIPPTRLERWMANKSDTLLCHVADIADFTHDN